MIIQDRNKETKFHLPHRCGFDLISRAWTIYMNETIKSHSDTMETEFSSFKSLKQRGNGRMVADKKWNRSIQNGLVFIEGLNTMKPPDFWLRKQQKRHRKKKKKKTRRKEEKLTSPTKKCKDNIIIFLAINF